VALLASVLLPSKPGFSRGPPSRETGLAPEPRGKQRGAQAARAAPRLPVIIIEPRSRPRQAWDSAAAARRVPGCADLGRGPHLASPQMWHLRLALRPPRLSFCERLVTVWCYSAKQLKKLGMRLLQRLGQLGNVNCRAAAQRGTDRRVTEHTSAHDVLRSVNWLRRTLASKTGRKVCANMHGCAGTGWHTTCRDQGCC